MNSQPLRDLDFLAKQWSNTACFGVMLSVALPCFEPLRKGV